MLRFGLKFSVVLLIGILIAGRGLLVTASTALSSPAAGCHGQSHSKSTSQPAGYQCCVTGHSPAIQPNLSAAFVPLLPVASVHARLLMISERAVVVLSENTASPPFLISLRI